MALKEMPVTIIRGPQEGHGAPGCHYVLVEDPDGIRLEVGFDPGHRSAGGRNAVQPSAGYI
jgi:hypothetical protein